MGERARVYRATYQWVAQIGKQHGVPSRLCIAAMHLVARTQYARSKREDEHAVIESTVEGFEALLIATRLLACCSSFNAVDRTVLEQILQQRLGAVVPHPYDDTQLAQRVRAARQRITTTMLCADGMGVSGSVYDFFWKLHAVCDGVPPPTEQDVVDAFACAFAIMPPEYAVDEITLAAVLAVAYHAANHTCASDCVLARCLDGRADDLFSCFARASVGYSHDSDARNS